MLIRTTPSWLLLLAGTCLSRVVTAFDKSCVPATVDAPYGLPKAQYDSFYHSVTQTYVDLLHAGCDAQSFSPILDCSLHDPMVVIESLDATSEACAQQLRQSAKDAHQFMVDYGCVDVMNVSDKTTFEELIHDLVLAATGTAPMTTCYAILETARRALEDATQSDQSVAIKHGPSLWAALFAGALAGLAVDLSLFPLDTIKTRLQSSAGFRASGGFANLYQGIGSIALGSAPSSALFFLAYEFAGKRLAQNLGETFLGHLLATTIGELASSVVRVPADVVKSRQQVELPGGGVQSAALWTAIRKVYEEGSRPNSHSRFSAFYTGWLSTIIREIPFGCIQFPLFSYLKSIASAGSEQPLGMGLTALCGMLAGSVAGSLTTPLDVVKTRIMLADKGESGIVEVLLGILKQDGVGGLFKGALPRTLWISAGGAIFLGGYDGFARMMDAMQ